MSGRRRIHHKKRPRRRGHNVIVNLGGRRRRRMRGAGIMDFLGRANKYLKGSKLVSKVGSALASAGVPYAGQIANVAEKLGYGRRRRGGALKLAGMGLSPAGGRRHYRHRAR